MAQCAKLAPTLVDIFEEAGYHVFHTVLYASDYGVPQKRKRFILVATCDDATFSPPSKTPVVSAKEALNASPRPPRGPKVSDRTRERILQLRRDGVRLIGGNYAVMDISKPAPTIHTQSYSATGPYTIERRGTFYSLSAEEAARLQSYPSTFEFLGSNTAIRRQIGNSVPPLLAATIAKGFQL